jgi:hypothetical protein
LLSEPGKGATVRVTVPQAKEPAGVQEI